MSDPRGRWLSMSVSDKDAQMLLEGKGLTAHVNVQMKDVPASIGSLLNALHQAGERVGLSHHKASRDDRTTRARSNANNYCHDCCVVR